MRRSRIISMLVVLSLIPCLLCPAVSSAACGPVRMPAGDEYTRIRIGIPAFRTNAFRQNAAVGEIMNAGSLRILWQAEAGGEASGGVWNGQPAISRWSVQVREASELLDGKSLLPSLKEVVIPGADGAVHFLDLSDGTKTREPLREGGPFTGTPVLDPMGLPYLILETTAGLRQYNMYRMEELPSLAELNGEASPTDLSAAGPAAAPVIDRTGDYVITAGSDGTLYLIFRDMYFDWENAQLNMNHPAVTVRYPEGAEDPRASVKAPVSVCDRFVFYADMGGILRCVNTDTLKQVWAADTGDSVLAAIALDQPEDGRTYLYTGNVLNLRGEGPAQIRRYSAETGDEIWHAEIGVGKAPKAPEEGTPSGCAASPVVGRENLKDLVFFTVTGLNDKGCRWLDVPDGTQAAVVALEKEDGALCWAKALPDRSVSSPAAVYDEAGNGWILQCAGDGTILLLDGLTGGETAVLSVGGSIQASPAVYNNIMVVSTTDGTVFGILID